MKAKRAKTILMLREIPVFICTVLYYMYTSADGGAGNSRMNQDNMRQASGTRRTNFCGAVTVLSGLPIITHIHTHTLPSLLLVLSLRQLVHHTIIQQTHSKVYLHVLANILLCLETFLTNITLKLPQASVSKDVYIEVRTGRESFFPHSLHS